MILSVGTNERSDFYEQWRKHKQVKIDAWPDIYDEGYKNQFRKLCSKKRTVIDNRKRSKALNVSLKHV